MRLIDADALMDKLGNVWGIPKDWDGDMDQTCEDAFTLIEDAPTIEAVSVVHGDRMQDFNNDLIRRTDALNMVHNFFLAKIKAVSGDREEIPMGELDPFLKDNKELSAKIKSIPDFEAAPVVHGEWILDLDEYDVEFAECSVCKEVFYDGENDTFDIHPNFCPNCGADMRKAV